MSLVDALHDVIDQQRKMLDNVPQSKPTFLAYAYNYVTFMEYQSKLENLHLMYVDGPEKLNGYERKTTILFLGNQFADETTERVMQAARLRDMVVLNVTEWK